jgi:hypothetical protein
MAFLQSKLSHRAFIKTIQLLQKVLTHPPSFLNRSTQCSLCVPKPITHPIADPSGVKRDYFRNLIISQHNYEGSLAPIVNRQSSIANHQSPITNHQSPIAAVNSDAQPRSFTSN